MSGELTTLFTGRHLTKLETAASTNSHLSSLLANGRLPEGAAIIADEQTAGRGQAGAKWNSEAGKNLLISFVFYPSFLSAKDLFLLNKTFSLAVYDMVSSMVNDVVKIKWSNDIYVNDKKICGMLIENSLRSAQVNHSILGIGLNINEGIFPKEIPNPVSLKQITGKEYNITECFNKLCECIESRYLQLKAGHQEKINHQYRQALYRLNEWHWYETDNERFKGKITDVNDEGKLCLLNENGNISQFEFKQIKFMLPNS